MTEVLEDLTVEELAALVCSTLERHGVHVVLSGGSVPPGAQVSEQAILDLEREAFLSLCGEPKTRDRIQHMLTAGKPLRN